jgi:hypothetical protein
VPNQSLTSAITRYALLDPVHWVSMLPID